jgi:hypothetical protein
MLLTLLTLCMRVYIWQKLATCIDPDIMSGENHCNHEGIEEVLVAECVSQAMIAADNKVRASSEDGEDDEEAASRVQSEQQPTSFILTPPQQVYPGAEAVKDPGYDEVDEDEGTVVWGRRRQRSRDGERCRR